jgi:hypothetical protein
MNVNLTLVKIWQLVSIDPENGLVSVRPAGMEKHATIISMTALQDNA